MSMKVSIFSAISLRVLLLRRLFYCFIQSIAALCVIPAALYIMNPFFVYLDFADNAPLSQGPRSASRGVAAATAPSPHALTEYFGPLKIDLPGRVTVRQGDPPFPAPHFPFPSRVRVSRTWGSEFGASASR